MGKQKNSTAAFSLVMLALVLSGFLILSGGNSGGAASQDTVEEITENEILITYSFSKPVIERNGEYDYPVMLELRNEINPGLPVVPVKDVQILLPQGEILENIEVLAKREVMLDGTYFIQPGGTPMSFSSMDGPVPPLEINSTIYNSEDIYPGELYSKVSVQWCRGYQILILKLHPMQYIPAQGKVLYYETFEVAVTTTFTGKISPLYRALSKDRNLVERMVDNPSVLATYGFGSEESSNGGIAPLSITDASDSYDYVIITNDTLVTPFQSFADYKNGTGIETVVVRVEDILADPDYDGVDNPERIRNFIKDAYTNWSVSYVLLGGDDEVIPHRGCYGYVDAASPKEDNDIPTDLYYGGLDRTWNEGANTSRWGEEDDNPDLYAEVYVGRAPVNTIIEVQTFHNKVLDFESNPRPKHVTLHGETDSSGPYYLDYIKNGEGGVWAPGVESYIPSNYNITRLYEREGVTIDVPTWESEIANDTLFVNHGGHGNVQSYEIQEGTFYNDGDADDIVNSYYPIHLSIACYSGAFDGRTTDATPPYSYVADNDSIAEEYLTNPDGGFVACILNSRYGWFLTGDVTAYSGELDNEFYNQLFNNTVIKIGKTLQMTKEEFASRALSDSTYRWVVYEWNLLGDPTLEILGKDNVTPIANAGPDNSTDEDSPILLDGSASTDNSGKIKWYNWSFGEGNQSNETVPYVWYSYADPGYYTAVLNVSDPSGNWDTDIVNITVYDATPPNTTLTIGEPKYHANQSHGWNVTSNTPFTLSAQDEGANCSGWNFTWYMIDSDYYDYTVSFNFSSYGEGTYTLTYGSEDLAGNNDTWTSKAINVDESEPTSSINVSSPKYGTGVDEINVTSTTPFTNSGVDNFAGINITWWYVNDIGNYSNITAFDFSGFGEGTYTLYYGAEDFLGNNQTVPNSITVIVDDTEPVTSLTIGNPKSGDEVTEINVTSSTTFTLSAFDNGVGENFTWYMIDTDYYVYSVPFDFGIYGEGIHTLTYGSEDLVENNHTGIQLTVKVDDSAPDTFLTIGTPKYGGKVIDINVTNATQLTINAVDNFAGTNTTWWYVNDIGNYSEISFFNFSGFGEGTYTLYYGASDLVGNNDTAPTSITVYVDDSDPITILTIGIPKHGDEVTAVNVTPTTSFDFLGGDATVGVDTEWWYVNDLANYTEGDNFDFLGKPEGTYTLNYGSRDLLGNNETVNSIIVYLDRRAPTTTLVVGDPKSRQIQWHSWNVTESTTFTLFSSDSYSGVAFTWYTIDGEYFEGTSFNLTGYGDGTHTIVYGSQDNLGYNESGETETVYLDLISPESNLEIGEPKYREDEDDYWNVTGTTLFTILASDNSSGVNTPWYVIDGNYSEGITFTLDGYDDGEHSITWGSRDKMGNNETGVTLTVFADTHSPDTSLGIVGPSYHSSDNDPWNVTSQTTFNLEAEDFYSGVNFTWFTIDGAYFQGTSFDLSGNSDGLHTLRWGSLDMSGNNETGNVMSLILDNSHPSTDIDLGTPRYRASGEDRWNVTGETMFSLTPEDSHSGVDVIWYTIDGAYFEGSESNLSGYGDGVHTLTWGSKDNLNNNESGNMMFVQLDNTPPSTSLSLGDPKYRVEASHSWNVTQGTFFNLNSVDEHCGVSSFWYTIDGEYFEGSEFLLANRVDGFHIVTYGALDMLGNNETANTHNVNLDTTPPVVTIYIRQQIPGPDSLVTLNSSTPITLISNDSTGVGITFIWFSLDGGTTYNIYKSPFTAPLNTSTVIYGAEDFLGNNATGVTVRLNVDDTEPDPEPEPDIDDDNEVIQPSEKNLFEMIMDNYYLFILLLIVIVVIALLVALLSRRKKGNGEMVAFQTEDGKGTTDFQVEDEKAKEEEEFEVEDDEGGFVEFEGDEKGSHDEDAKREVEWEPGESDDEGTGIDWEE